MRALASRRLRVARADADRPALGLASGYGRVECVRALLDAGAALDRAPDAPNGRTALMWALSYGSVECVVLLLARGAAPSQARDDGRSALMVACEGGDAECARLLLDAGADVRHEMPDSGGTALCFGGRNLAPVQLLCAHAARRGAHGPD